MADINLNDEVLQHIIAQNILETVSEEQKNDLLKSALKFLMNPVDRGYGLARELSPLALAFQEQIVSVAKDVVAEFVNSKDVHSVIETTIRTQISEWVANETWDLSKIISTAIRENLDLYLRD